MRVTRCIIALFLLAPVSDALHCIDCLHYKYASASLDLSHLNYIDEDCKHPGTSTKESIDCDETYSRAREDWGDDDFYDKQYWDDYYASLGRDRTVCTEEHYNAEVFVYGMYITIEHYYRGCRKVDENTWIGCNADLSADQRKMQEELGGVVEVDGEICLCDTDNCNADDGNNWYREDDGNNWSREHDGNNWYREVYGRNAASIITVSVWIKFFHVGLLLMISG